MESTLKNMVLTLLIITLAAAGILGLVYSVTQEPIMAARAAKTTDALSKVLPDFDNDPGADTTSIIIDGLPAMVYTARQNGNVVGYAVESMTRNGFSGEIKMMTGFLPGGDIYNIEVLLHNETPGLGSKMTDPGNVLLVSFQGKNPADLQMKVTKDGGDIDALTASTISSRAYTEAVQSAYEAFRAVAWGEEPEENLRDYVSEVLPVYTELELRTVNIDGQPINVHIGYDNGDVTGYAIETATDSGYNGEIVLMTGFDSSGNIHNIEVVSHSETPGFGAAIADADNSILLSFRGQDPGKLKMSLKIHGGDIDAISASTISSEAYIEAVQKAYEAYKIISGRN